MRHTRLPSTAFVIASLCLVPALAVAQEEPPSDTASSSSSESSASSGDRTTSEEGDEAASSDDSSDQPSSSTSSESSEKEDDTPSSDDSSGDQSASSTSSKSSEKGDEGASGETSGDASDADSGDSGDDESSNDTSEAMEQLKQQMNAKSDSGDKEEGGKDGGDSSSESPISGLAGQSDDDGFAPVEGIEEEALQEITPAKIYPYLEWEGMFQVHSDADVNFDLNTSGTSAILPPLGNNLPADGPPADPDNGLLWSTDMDFRLDPTFHITERLSIHTEIALLDNLVLGSLSKHRLTGASGGALHPDPSRTVTGSSQLTPRELEWGEDSIQVNEAYGQVEFFLGTFRAGRMDFDWGLGMFANGGDCIDCNFGDHVDRIMFRTKPWKFHTMAAVDFPDQGETSQSASRPQGQPYDLAQVDDAQQYTFAIFRKAMTEKEKNLRQQRLKDQQKPVFEGGALFMFRNQDGAFVRGSQGNSLAGSRESDSARGSNENQGLIYRGLNLYMPDVWGRMVYEPDPDTYVRVELELNGAFGEIDNATSGPVGTGEDADEEAINCFNEDTRESNPRCTPSDEKGPDILQIGAALESELHFGGPVRFGLNGGFASGGDARNWGYNAVDGSQLDFYRFDPNYHVDLILFREVIGTVTNAYYANPYVQARFFETPEHRLELQFDTITSRVADGDGAPSTDSKWLGLELDVAARYIQVGAFQVGLEGGVLFPFGALNADTGAAKLTQPDPTAEPEFTQSSSADIAWTIQSNFVWQF